MNSILTQVGITSHGSAGGCGQKGVPGFYTSVGHELCFINYSSECLSSNSNDYFDHRAKCKDWEAILDQELDEMIEQKKKEQLANPDDIIPGIILKKKESSKKFLEELLERCSRKKQLLVSLQKKHKYFCRSHTNSLLL